MFFGIIKQQGMMQKNSMFSRTLKTVISLRLVQDGKEMYDLYRTAIS